jgi:hypothetical protein
MATTPAPAARRRPPKQSCRTDAGHPVLPSEVFNRTARHSHDGDPRLTMRTPCHARFDQSILILLNVRGACAMLRRLHRMRRNCRRRQILPGVYASLTIRRRSSASPARSPRCASTDRTAPRLDRPRATRGEPARPAFRCRKRRRSRRAALAARPRPPATSMRCWRCRASRIRPSAASARWRGAGARSTCSTSSRSGLLSGNLDASTVNRLRDAAANLKSSSGDPGLDAVLSEIELRVEVELAKAGQFFERFLSPE